MAWMQDLFGSIDRMEVESFCSFLSDDVSFTFGNAPTVTGVEKVKETVSEFFSAISSLSHRIVETIEKEGTTVVRGEVTYTRKDNSTLTVPFCNVFKREDEKVKEYVIYVDVSGLFKN